MDRAGGRRFSAWPARYPFDHFWSQKQNAAAITQPTPAIGISETNVQTTAFTRHSMMANSATRMLPTAGVGSRRAVARRRGLPPDGAAGFCHKRFGATPGVPTAGFACIKTLIAKQTSAASIRIAAMPTNGPAPA